MKMDSIVRGSDVRDCFVCVPVTQENTGTTVVRSTTVDRVSAGVCATRGCVHRLSRCLEPCDARQTSMSLEPRRNEWPAETNEHQGCCLNQEYFVKELRMRGS
jgi:hypothetical protein